jgi:hypothetical protein
LQIEDEVERAAVIKEAASHKALNTDMVKQAVVEAEGVRIIADEVTPGNEIPPSEWEHLLEPGVLVTVRRC